MAGITDVGKSNADGGSDHMRESASEYQDFIDDAIRVIDDTESDVEQLRSAVASIFG